MCFFLLSCQAESWCPPPSLPVLHHMKILPSSSCIRVWRGCTTFSTSTHRAYRSCWSLPSGKAASDLAGLPVCLRQVHGWQPCVSLLVLCSSVSPSFGSYNFLMYMHRGFCFIFVGRARLSPLLFCFPGPEAFHSAGETCCWCFVGFSSQSHLQRALAFFISLKIRDFPGIDNITTCCCVLLGS